jgi:hypothetical protein
MFDCSVTFSLSESGQKKAIANGLSGASQQKVVIQLPIELLTSELIRIEKNGQAGFHPSFIYRFDHIPTESDIVPLITKFQADKEVKEKETEDFVNVLKVSNEAKREGSVFFLPGFSAGRNSADILKYITSDELEEIRKGISTRERAKEVEKENERNRIKEEKLAKAREWIDAHGSSRLKKLFTAGFSYKAVAKEEWAAKNIPTGFRILEEFEGDVRQRLSPSEEEMDDLALWSEIKKTTANLVSVGLSWNVPEDDDAENYATLDLEFETPFENTVKFEQVYPAEEIEHMTQDAFLDNIANCSEKEVIDDMAEHTSKSAWLDSLPYQEHRPKWERAASSLWDENK